MKRYLFFAYLSVWMALGARNSTYEWIIVGAGPAGIVTVGVLLDLGVRDDAILWIDPAFDVGRLGEKYGTVPANTKTKLFVEFINACQTFKKCHSTAIEALYAYDQEKEYALQIIIDPLQDISNYLCTRVHTCKGSMQALGYDEHELWNVAVGDYTYKAQHVVLATGSHPRSLEYPCNNEIPLDIALNKNALARVISPTDSVAVVGGAHSAVLVMKFLSELPVGRILNFYHSPLVYPVDNGVWIENLYEGLKGCAAQWAREVLEKRWPANLVRIFNTEASRAVWLPLCNKIIYAIGYDRNSIPLTNSLPITYDCTGKIGTKLFGIGIAFPEIHTYPNGITAPRIGLNSFMEYAQRVIPHWIALKNDVIRARLRAFEELFSIELL